MSSEHIPWSLVDSARGKIDGEVIDEILSGGRFRLERIVSFGQATPDGDWYDQELAEWVILLSGSAAVRFEDDETDIQLRPGDVLHILPHQRHRVSWTEAGVDTVWLALHYEPSWDDAA